MEYLVIGVLNMQAAAYCRFGRSACGVEADYGTREDMPDGLNPIIPFGVCSRGKVEANTKGRERAYE
jgi:hypothetical protein